MPALRPLLAPNTFLPRRSLVLIHQAINHLLCRGGTARPAGARNPKHRVCSGWVQSSYLLDSTRPSAPKKPIGDGGLQLRAAAGRKGQATGHRAFSCSDTAGMRLVGISISYITALGLWSGSGPGWLGLNVTSSQWLFGGALCRSPRAGIHTTKSTTQRALIQRQQTRPRAQTSSEGSPAGPGRGTVAARGSRPLGTAWQGHSGEQECLVPGVLTPATLNSHLPKESERRYPQPLPPALSLGPMQLGRWNCQNLPAGACLDMGHLH